MTPRHSQHASSPLLSGTILDEQIKSEMDAVRNGVIRYRRLAKEAVDRGDGAGLKPAERMLAHWYAPMVEAVRGELRAIRRRVPDTGRNIFGPYMLLLDSERLAVITLGELLSTCMLSAHGAQLSTLAYSIGRAVLAEINLDTIKTTDKKSLRKMSHRMKRITPQGVNWWARRTLDDPVWGRSVCVHMGTRLIWMLIGVASAAGYGEPFQLAFHHERKWVKGKQKAFVRMDDMVYHVIEKGHALRQYMRPRYEPMLVPPYKWSERSEGGYIRVRTSFISKATQSQKKALDQADLSHIYTCLDAVNSTPWRINKPLYDIICQVWESGGGALGIPHRDDHPIPPSPKDWGSNEPAKLAWKKDASAAHKRNVLLKGVRVEFLNKLASAGSMIERDVVWFPHQLDFRGRCYPVPPHLNHQGDDLSRSLLEFAEACAPLDDRGMFWIKVHVANCYGMDKLPYDQRLTWVQEHSNEIERCVGDPMGTAQWWSRADKPWQFLAACFALHSPNCARHLPIQLDGTCNGLQHYAAMGRDGKGAQVVNLMPSDQPADIYSDVAKVVGRSVGNDADAGHDAARLLANMITRKLVKRPVMTSVYGVTMVGARQQIREELAGQVADETLYDLSNYLSQVTLNSIGQVCSSATNAMHWLNQCAKAISAGKEGSLVCWKTPLGMPVVQHYRNNRVGQIRTIMQKVSLVVPDTGPVAPGKQTAAFAPNFVHSVDATHMLMTARACHDAGIAFAAVHDSYWTHAVTVDRMNVLLREQFVQLHEKPLLHVLHGQLSQLYPQAGLPDPPAVGDLDITQVLGSTYFFS